MHCVTIRDHHRVALTVTSAKGVKRAYFDMFPIWDFYVVKVVTSPISTGRMETSTNDRGCSCQRVTAINHWMDSGQQRIVRRSSGVPMIAVYALPRTPPAHVLDPERLSTDKNKATRKRRQLSCCLFESVMIVCLSCNGLIICHFCSRSFLCGDLMCQ